MAKVFTITEGLDNMGALKSGGQGSIYKARRIGEIITAVKLLPTPVNSKSREDKNYADFINEVKKLERVNETPNPHVVQILSHGITESGSFPFIEMEFIEGPDLQELLQPPHAPIFSLKEAIKVAEQLANALAHCHRVDVRHGDIKSNNVKYNSRTGNYMLLDFGLAVLSDEERRTSLRRAGAVEFMAPEQGDGVLLFQSDVYGFGVILFELLAGIVPFPLTGNTDTARNAVMLAHRETPVPDLLSVRKKHLPKNWNDELKEKEMRIPKWLLEMITTCLEKVPQKRFPNGVQLYEFICSNSLPLFNAGGTFDEKRSTIEKENTAAYENINEKQVPRLSKRLIPFFILGVGLLIFLISRVGKSSNAAFKTDSTQPISLKAIAGQYKVVAPRTYFFDKADESSKKGAYLIPSNDVISAFDEKNGFVYTELTHNNGQIAKGWLRKQDLISLDDLLENGQGKLPVQLNPSDIEARLQEAKRLLQNRGEKAAMRIYQYLADLEVPEAMYQYGNHILQNRNEGMDCKKGYELVRMASEKGYTPAKGTLGFLYAFGENNSFLQAANYTDCGYKSDLQKGGTLLLEATLEGDTTAKRWLHTLNHELQQGSYAPFIK